jgi:HPt (histidine-containing phosphotransfer) domain-containing protein
MSGSSAEAPAWDSKIVEQLRDELDDHDGSVISSILRLYIAETPQILDDLERAANAADGPQLQFSAHALKGSTVAVGGIRLAAVCQDLERAGVSTVGLGERVNRLRQEFTELANALEHYLQTRGLDTSDQHS